MKFRKTLTSWLTTKYILIIRNEDNFADEATLNFTYARLVLFIMISFLIMLLTALYLVKTVLGQWFDPRSAQIETNTQLIHLAMKVDSLESASRSKDAFIHNLMGIMSGQAQADSVVGIPTANEQPQTRELDKTTLAQIDSQFRADYESGNQSLLNDLDIYSANLQEIFFFAPLTGIVSQRFDLKQEHYGIDVVSKENEPIKSVADGTVVLSSWTQDAGYVLAIQHRTNLISVYKHNSALLKKVGSFVNAGEVIAIIGNSGELTSGPHLHLEIWYNGNPVNPEELFLFNP
ncbi:MAG: M23 family metallopeptidase [Cytophagales bacterium]|nr:M23 family metallopeptidase [Cytophagales bacterium]